MTAVMVFSHPNHEVALLGTIARLKPHLVFLTDGGGEARVAQTRQGLASYVDADALHFLGHREQALYDGLLDGDVPFYSEIAREVCAIVGVLRPDAVFCDMVEFYNPVHDMALPVVRAALAGREVPVLEVPLIWEKDDGSGCEIQRAPASVAAGCAWTELTAEEAARKAATLRAGIYRMLFAQVGAEIESAMPTHAAREQVVPARPALPSPAPGQALRYDRRGRAAEAAGTVARAITFADHYVPMYRALCA
jgi:hypothetical protein